LLGSAFLFAILESWDAFRILLACSPLVGAFFLNALLRISKDESSGWLGGLETVVSSSTFSNIDGGLTSFGGEAELPA